ncbi:MAG: hypothetical protein KAH01_06290 [Caldisericia bacterium]|nr:hypothetical protein [Caldisericia bacterium]
MENKKTVYNKKKIKFSETRTAGFIFGILAFLIVISPFALWALQPYYKLHTWILDKTVPTQEYREHRGVMWALNFYRITDPVRDNIYFKRDRDYYGFFPLKPDEYEIKDLCTATPNPDLIFLADTYGVYTDDYWEPNILGNRSKLIYGGLTGEDVFTLKKNLKNNVTLIASFNTLATPTKINIRKKAENILGIEWEEWMGRFFIDLSENNEVAVWMIDNWEKQHDAEWNFTGPGFVLCSNSDQVEVMEEKKHFKGKDIFFKFLEPYNKEFKINSEISYYYWFSFISPMKNTEVLAKYSIDVTDEGKKLLDSIGLNSVFPAITRKKTQDYTAYYMAGDFEDHKATGFLWQVYGLDKVREWFSLDFRGESSEYYWKGYIPFTRKVLFDVIKQKKENAALNVVAKKEKEVFVEDGTRFISRTNGQKLEIYKEDHWEEFFVKGINIGMALPGHWFTQFPDDEDVYYSWFSQIADLNVNTLRIYTLIDPAFYRALYLYNIDNLEKPIWLLQGVWPEEHPENNDYWNDTYLESFKKEIEWGVDAIHGSTTIPQRKGRAFGRYIADVSPWTLGYLVGRELEAQEVEDNNNINLGKKFNGEFIGVKSDSTPTEAWIAWACNETMKYEKQEYKWQRPVSIVSWPTLDFEQHESEWSDRGDKSNQFNDLEVVDIRNFIVSDKCKAGFFGTYHIYPNYPDFMNNEKTYESYFDSDGSFMYGGYLKEFFGTHTGYPALVGEFGMATGMGTAHENPTGLHHGGVSEIEQGEMIVRMMKSIKNEDYIGGCIFEWMDEWAKKTWTTESFMIPYEHHVYWHNAICPEQNYGILANETVKPDKPDVTISDKNGIIEKVELSHDATFVYIDLYSKQKLDFNTQNLLIGLDTYNRNYGNFRYSPHLSLEAPTGIEFLVKLTKDERDILVNPSYNIGRLKFSSKIDKTGKYEIIDQIINKSRITKAGRFIPEIRDNGSKLTYGNFVGNTNNYFIENEKVLHLRIPWGRLNVTDPTSRTVLNDNKKYNYYPDRDVFDTQISSGFIITAVITNENGTIIDVFPGSIHSSKIVEWDELKPYAWKTWTWETPPYVQRKKKSYSIIQNYFAK